MRFPGPCLCLALMATLAACDAASAHDPISTRLTWTREISPLFAVHCASCHKPGGSAPMALSSYADVRPWAVAIRDEIAARRMPPWNAVRGFRRLAGDASLSQEEIQWITDWVNGGAPEGDPASPLAPPIPSARAPLAPASPASWPVYDRAAPPAGSLLGVAVRELPPATVARLLLRHPDGRLEPLLWLRPTSPHAPALYYFAEPVTVKPGSTLRLWTEPAGAKPPRLELLASPSRNPPAAPE